MKRKKSCILFFCNFLGAIIVWSSSGWGAYTPQAAWIKGCVTANNYTAYDRCRTSGKDKATCDNDLMIYLQGCVPPQ